MNGKTESRTFRASILLSEHRLRRKPEKGCIETGQVVVAQPTRCSAKKPKETSKNVTSPANHTRNRTPREMTQIMVQRDHHATHGAVTHSEKLYSTMYLVLYVSPCNSFRCRRHSCTSCIRRKDTCHASAGCPACWPAGSSCSTGCAVPEPPDRASAGGDAPSSLGGT